MTDIDKQKYNILIVDDSSTNLKFITSLLKLNKSYIPHSCSSGEEAIEFIESNEKNMIDIVLLDIIMPGIDGFDTCLKLRELGFENRIIFISGSEDDESLTRGFSVGGNDYIRKPFKYSELFARVNLHLQMSELSKLNEKSKSKEMYEAVAVASNHHMRQPLTIISGNIELFMMKEKENVSEESLALLKRGLDSVEEIVEILERFKEIDNPIFEDYVEETKMVKLFDNDENE